MSASDPKLSMAFELLREAEDKLSSVRHILESEAGSTNLAAGKKRGGRQDGARQAPSDDSLRIVEGAFDGQSMIGEDKKIYPVPANYASKSKLVEGDTLKLTVASDGSFIFKQISPVERKHVCGALDCDERGEFFVKVGRKEYRVLIASVTFFKGASGDEVTLIVPTSGRATWGAIENIIKKTGGLDPADLLRKSDSDVTKQHPKSTNSFEDYDEADDQKIPIEESIKKTDNSSEIEE